MSGIVGALYAVAASGVRKTLDAIDAVFPPDQRAQTLSRVQEFTIHNPKLAAFLLANIVLTGIPVLMFLAFSVAVLAFSLATALLVAVMGALCFTGLLVGLAFLLILPAVLISTFCACSLFVWGLCGFYILRWFSRRGNSTTEAPSVDEKPYEMDYSQSDPFVGDTKTENSDVMETKKHGHFLDEDEPKVVVKFPDFPMEKVDDAGLDVKQGPTEVMGTA